MKTNERRSGPRITRKDTNKKDGSNFNFLPRLVAILGGLLVLIAGAGWALAADPASPSTGGAVQISGSASLSGVQVVIPLLVPLAIAFLKLILPRVPSAWIPVLAPILGMLADLAAAKATGGVSSPMIGAVLGSAGVGLREVVDQLRKSTSNIEHRTSNVQVGILAACLGLGLTGCANLSSRTTVIRPDGSREETKMWGYAIGGADNALAKFHNSPTSMVSSNGWAMPAGTTIGTATQSAQQPSVGDIIGQAMKAYTGK
jgi:hypothetical protein